MATMVSSRLTVGASNCTCFCRSAERFCGALTDCSAFLKAPGNPASWPTAWLASCGAAARRARPALVSGVARLGGRGVSGIDGHTGALSGEQGGGVAKQWPPRPVCCRDCCIGKQDVGCCRASPRSAPAAADRAAVVAAPAGAGPGAAPAAGGGGGAAGGGGGGCRR